MAIYQHLVPIILLVTDKLALQRKREKIFNKKMGRTRGLISGRLARKKETLLTEVPCPEYQKVNCFIF